MAVRNLNVELCGASGLKNSEYIGKSDPYVILRVGKTERTSKVAEDQATAPSWNEKFTLPVVDGDTELVIRILNDNTMAKDDELGHVVIPLSEIRGSHAASTFELQCKGKPQGELKMNLSFEVEGDHESKGLVEKIHDLFVGEKEAHEEKHKEHREEESQETSEEHHHQDEASTEKLEERIEELKENAEEKKEKSVEKADESKEEVEEKAEKKKKGKKGKKEKKSKQSGDEGSSSSSDSESDKDDD